MINTTIRKVVINLLMLCLTAISASTVLAKGGELKFNSIVLSVNQLASFEGSITVTIHDVDVELIVNGDTEIGGSGEEIGLATISAGDFVRTVAYFTDAGLVADSIEVLDSKDEQFRLRGLITGVDTVAEVTSIVVMGVGVSVNADADITQRGSGSGNNVLAADLQVGDLVNIKGGTDGGLLVATRIHVGNREQGNIELEGEVVTVSDTQVSISIEGGTTVAVVIDDDTSVVGELVEGVFVEVEGRLLEDLSLIAFEIAVDEDGDGDADDDHKRGKRGDKHSNNGRDNNNGKNGDDDDDDEDGSDSDQIEVSAEITLSAEGQTIHGSVEYIYVAEGDDIGQELDVELKDGELETDYMIKVLFGEELVELATVTSDDEGELKANFSSQPVEGDIDLSGLLPEGSDVRDITAVQIFLDDSLILTGEL